MKSTKLCDQGYGWKEIKKMQAKDNAFEMVEIKLTWFIKTISVY